eukprot:2750937-Rhodomonas_salina.2
MGERVLLDLCRGVVHRGAQARDHDSSPTCPTPSSRDATVTRHAYDARGGAQRIPTDTLKSNAKDRHLGPGLHRKGGSWGVIPACRIKLTY